jgi:hypothetical protein
LPTSVTTPILRSEVAGGTDAASDGAVDGAVEAAVDGAAADGAVDGAVEPVLLLQAATRMDNPANRVSPVLRIRMCVLLQVSRTESSATVC